MFSQDLEKLIQHHGEAARLYENEAIQIGDIYIIPNFGFALTIQTSLESLVDHRRSWNQGVVDIRVFVKPKDCKLFGSDEETTEIEYIDLMQLCRGLYPCQYFYPGLPEWWTQEDMLAASEVMDSLDFAIWMEDKFCPQELEEGAFDTWLKLMKPWLGEEIMFYKMEDDDDSNCGFAPYLFVGDRCLVLVARRWQL